jgi:hypothetical protein
MLFMTAISQDDGLTFGEVLANLPHDAAAIVIYVLVALFIGFIWHGSRNRSEPTAQAGSRPDADQEA